MCILGLQVYCWSACISIPWAEWEGYSDVFLCSLKLQLSSHSLPDGLRTHASLSSTSLQTDSPLPTQFVLIPACLPLGLITWLQLVLALIPSLRPIPKILMTRLSQTSSQPVPPVLIVMSSICNQTSYSAIVSPLDPVLYAAAWHIANSQLFYLSTFWRFTK